MDKEKLLLEDYRTSLQLLCHEDGRKSHLFNLFFMIQGGLLGFYYWTSKTNSELFLYIPILAITLSCFWYFLISRIHAFIGLRYFQLIAIEDELVGLCAIKNEQNLREQGEIEFLDKKYSLSWRRFFSVTKTEAILPVIIAIFWILLLAGNTWGLLKVQQ